jgi:GTP cyclohydrolase II
MLLQRIAETELPTPWGKFQLVGFHDAERKQDPLALIIGEVTTPEPVLARLHSECLTGDALFSLRCDCGFQLQASLRKIAEAGRGVLLYHRQEGRGIGLLNKLRAYALQDHGADTVEANHQLGFAADERDFTQSAQLLRLLGVSSLRLLTNNPHKVAALQQAGLNVVERVPLHVGHNDHNQQYLAVKASKLGHWLAP